MRSAAAGLDMSHLDEDLGVGVRQFERVREHQKIVFGRKRRLRKLLLVSGYVVV